MEKQRGKVSIFRNNIKSRPTFLLIFIMLNGGIEKLEEKNKIKQSTNKQKQQHEQLLHKLAQTHFRSQFSIPIIPLFLAYIVIKKFLSLTLPFQ